MHPDRYFDPDPTIRGIARELYESTERLPIVSPHGHVDARILADDTPFPEPTSLLILPDHYILRMLYSQGVPLERLGVVPRQPGNEPVETNPRTIWRTFSQLYYLFRGTPTAAWLDYQLVKVFGIATPLNELTGLHIYDEIVEKLTSREFHPRALFDRFNIDVLATTDAAADPLDSHRRIRASGWHGRVIPTFRPDALFQISAPGWPEALEALGAAAGVSIGTFIQFVEALAARRAAFRSLGATATDHGVHEPHTERLEDDAASAIFTRAQQGAATADDERRFQAHLLMEMARLSVEDGLVMQLHAGSLRNHNRLIFDRFGPDRGADIPTAAEYTRNLRPLLNEYGNDPRFRVIVFTLDESTYARELAPLAGHYPALLLGPPWWFHDSIEGMIRYRQQTTETAGLYNTSGFNDDTRAFCSIPARHDLARRVDANWLAGLVARHIVSRDDALVMARELAGDLARRAYRLDAPQETSSAAIAPR